MNRRFVSPSQNGQPATNDDETRNEVDVKLDRVNELWSKLERKLLRRQPPRHICVLVDSQRTGEHGDYMERRFLGLQRQNGKWRVCYAADWPQCCDDDGPHDFPTNTLSWKPVAECDLETRVKMSAPEYIDDLKCEIDKTRTFFIPQLDKTIDRLEAALDD